MRVSESELSTEFAVDRPDTTLAAQRSGAGAGVLLLHGLSATRRYVLHGSTAIERAGYQVVSYDARGHGDSTPANHPETYDYDTLGEDAVAVLDRAGIDRAILIGQSMGAATAVNVALRHPERVAGLVVVTPAHLGAPSNRLERWDRLARGLREAGVEGFMEAYGDPPVPERWRDTIKTVIRQRLSRHVHPAAVADALSATPRSAAFDGMDELTGIAVPTLIVASLDELDPDHPLRIAEQYVRTIPNAEFLIENPGESPLAWRGGSLSAGVLRFLADSGLGPADSEH
ncbi:MAG: alpha/beta hydrolase [Thermoleophilia bacterium]|nr:alpha/beta hydrolase [Thermoleophilia bacterium]